MNIFVIIFAIGGAVFVLYHAVLYVFTRVPYVGTPQQRIEPIFDYLDTIIDSTSGKRFVDIGAGYGLVLFAAEKNGFQKPIGYELSPLHVWCGNTLARVRGSSVRIQRCDFFAADISQADVLYVFLNANAFPQLERKIFQESKNGAVVITLSDPFSHHTPIHSIQNTDSGSTTFFYQVGES